MAYALLGLGDDPTPTPTGANGAMACPPHYLFLSPGTAEKGPGTCFPQSWSDEHPGLALTGMMMVPLGLGAGIGAYVSDDGKKGSGAMIGAMVTLVTAPFWIVGLMMVSSAFNGGHVT